MIAWSEALHCEEAASGVHVGLVLPGFVVTEGFPPRDPRPRVLAPALMRRAIGTAQV
jgi:short-subunit dehydrogenase